MKKKIIATISVFVILLVGTFSVVHAVFRDKKIEESSFTTSYIDIKLHTTGSSNNNQDFWGESDSSTNIYVRAKITPILEFDNADGNWELATLIPITAITYDIDTTSLEDWVQDGEFWYYKKILKPSELTTEFLMDNIVVENDADVYNGAELRVTMNIQLEATQSSNDLYKSNWNISQLPVGVEQ